MLALETSCDDTCAAVVTGAGEIRANVISSQERPRPLRRRRARGRLAPAPRAGQRRRRRRAAPRRAPRSTTSTLVAVDRRARAWSARCSSALATAKGLAAARELPLAPVDHLQGHVAASFLGPGRRSSRRSSASSPAAATRFLARVDDHASLHRPRRRRSTTRRGRPSTRAPGCSGCPIPAARTSSAWPRDGDPARLRVPDRRAASRAWTSRSPGVKTALLYAIRDLGPEAAAARARRPRGELPARDRRGARPARASARCAQTGLDRAGRRRRRGGQRAAARAPGRRWPRASPSRRASCAPTTRR